MKTQVEVRIEAVRTVVITVEHGEDEDPCDLTAADRAEALEEAELPREWYVEVITPRLADSY